jgi:hypothetical protein
MLLVAVKWESQSGFRENQADLNEETYRKIPVAGLDQLAGWPILLASSALAR